MTHDPLCPYKPQAIGHGSTSGDVQAAAPAVACQCDLIANVREDERKGIIGSVELAAIGQANQQAYRDGQRDMLAKCIAAVEDIQMYASTVEEIMVGFDCAKREILRALHSLQEKP